MRDSGEESESFAADEAFPKLFTDIGRGDIISWLPSFLHQFRSVGALSQSTKDKVQDPKPKCAAQKTQKCQIFCPCVLEICSNSDRLTLEC